jgi:hypothetical protein
MGQLRNSESVSSDGINTLGLTPSRTARLGAPLWSHRLGSRSHHQGETAHKRDKCDLL